jgi:tetratricopeptide (TPR) repeat protein
VQDSKQSSAARWSDIAERILPRIPPASVPQTILDGLRSPTREALANAGSALFDAGEFELSGIVFGALARHPGASPFPFVKLAQIAEKRGEPSERIAAWQTCIETFPQNAKPDWYFGLANALRAANRLDEEQHALDALAARFPEQADSLAFQALGAERRGQLSRSADLWLRYFQKAAAATRPAWLNAAAKALLRDGQFEHAMEIWRETLRRHPDFEAAYPDFANACSEFGRWADAERLWDTLTHMAPARDNPLWHFNRARCAVNDPSNNTVDAAIAELQARFPQSPYGWQLAIEAATIRKWGLEATLKIFGDASERFPDDRRLIGKTVPLLLASGRFDEAERMVERLEASGDDDESLIGRWRIDMDREGAEKIRQSVEHAVTARLWEPAPCLAICGFLDSLNLLWSYELSLDFCEQVLGRTPEHFELRRLRAGLLIRLGRDHEALDRIDALPAIYETANILELRAWAAAYRGLKAEEEAIRERILLVQYNGGIHAAEPNLELVSGGDGPSSSEPVVLFAVMRDEMDNLPDFFRHHRQIGVRKFVVVDNMSVDGTADWLGAQPDVILYRTADNFPAAASGMRWINALLEIHAGGKWCLYADADERFIYPGWEHTPVGRLAGYLDASGALAMPGLMLDVYPERLIDEAGRRATHADCRYYDDNHVSLGQTQPPYKTPTGGVRYRLFSIYERLHKSPLIKAGAVRYLDPHLTTTSRYSDVTSLLLHTKCIDLVTKAGQSGAPGSVWQLPQDRHPFTMRRYQRYAYGLETIATMDLRQDGVTKELADSLVLADRGLMHAPEEYRHWLRDG